MRKTYFSEIYEEVKISKFYILIISLRFVLWSVLSQELLLFSSIFPFSRLRLALLFFALSSVGCLSRKIQNLS